MSKLWTYLVFLIFLIGYLNAEDWSSSGYDGHFLATEENFACRNLPAENYTCASCIQQHESCAWCSFTDFDSNNQYPRCDNVKRLEEHGCPQNEIEFPIKKYEVIEDKPLSNERHVDDKHEEDAVQLKPQEVEIVIRPTSKVRFEVTYKQALDYPVDLYYLMDLSYSMKDDKQKLSELGDLLSSRMKSITRNFRLGFGSFIDKKLMPFVDPRPEKQISPCAEPCAEPYGFKNQMKLTQNTNRFSKEVQEALISGNLDAPEGGFDALMQALTCDRSIGWRERARKMIVFSTDAGFHYAGDGRLAGLVTPNDGQCHLNDDGFYTKSLEQDYPSIALLHQKTKEKKVNLIFAVTETHKNLYRQLSEALPDISSSVGVLADDSSNIVQLIEEEYNKISEKIIMVDNVNASSGLKISYRSKCLNGKELTDTNVCDNIKVGDEVTFEVTLEAVKCVDKRDFELLIGPSGLEDTLKVNVKVLCDCDCQETPIKNSPLCNGGTLACGICTCLPGFSGKDCGCKVGDIGSLALENKCKMTPDSLPCSGKGDCHCGKCSCFSRENINERIYGEFCECTNYDCPRHDRKLCNDHGTCNCGVCECIEGFSGKACECPTSVDTCMGDNGLICSGHGECLCGKCVCHDTDTGGKYSGPVCDICPTCPTKCVEYKPCVMCQQWQTGPYNETKCDDCPFTVIPVKELPVLNVTEYESQECQFVDTSDDCTFYFTYYTDGKDNLTVWVKEQKDCPSPFPVLVVVLAVIAGIVLLGLLLICLWKLLTVLHDRREYAKFEQERLLAQFGANENPIFVQATRTYANPVYAGRNN
uniref:Integrin beta n=1 Tax=Rhabditophanes sp. KR3021 TaxID=114890 RepID=A0AC35TMN0_9BILA